VQAGSDLYVAPDSQAGFSSDYNLLNRGGGGGAASTGFWGGVLRAVLSDWQTASGQDVHSSAADPLFIDVDGADNVLGYNTAGAGYNGGLDDNFYLGKSSPAIDAGDSWSAPRADADARTAPANDPAVPNAGSPEYSPAGTGNNAFTATGTAQNFPQQRFLLQPQPSVHLQLLRRQLHQPGDRQHRPDPPGRGGQHPLRRRQQHRQAHRHRRRPVDRRPLGPPRHQRRGQRRLRRVQHHRSGQVDQDPLERHQRRQQRQCPVRRRPLRRRKDPLDYGPGGNTGLSPTVGISSGNGYAWQTVPGYDGAATLANANSVLWSLAAGFRDIGAFEFGGNSSDATAPTVQTTSSATGSLPTDQSTDRYPSPKPSIRSTR